MLEVSNESTTTLGIRGSQMRRSGVNKISHKQWIVVTADSCFEHTTNSPLLCGFFLRVLPATRKWNRSHVDLEITSEQCFLMVHSG